MTGAPEHHGEPSTSGREHEPVTKHRFEQAMRDNRFVVAVATPTDDRKERATEIFRAHGAYGVTFFGKHTLEYIVPPGKR